MMDVVADIGAIIGGLFMIIGGATICFALVALLASLATELWIDASNRFRDICKAESLIHEYKRERDKYMKWKEETNGKHNA